MSFRCISIHKINKSYAKNLTIFRLAAHLLQGRSVRVVGDKHGGKTWDELENASVPA